VELIFGNKRNKNENNREQNKISRNKNVSRASFELYVEQTFLIERTNNFIARNKKLCIGEQKGKFRNNNLWY
jgi:hypothetical protein